MTADNGVNRRGFIELSAGIIGGLGIPGVLGKPASGAEVNSQTGTALDPSYLEKGLTGMARSEGWFNAHLGAAVLAGYYLCNENQLGDATIAGIKEQLDALIRVHASQFAPFPESTADKSLIDDIPKALMPAVEGGLRAHGHAVIYASLSMRALRDAPQMAQPQLIKKLCGLSGQIARQQPEKPANPAGYADSQAMIEATFDSLARFKHLVGRPTVRRPNFTHMTTHTEALMSLDAMGYPDLASMCHLGHRAHISASVPEFDPAEHPVDAHPATLGNVMSQSYWESEENLNQWNKKWSESSNPNGYWVAFGHLFKVLYSYHRLIGRIKDQEKVSLCSQVLLERYLNPNVKGG